ncbi:hybrid sensor histidine kinase/response regulator [Deinococcus roseus]|uniref:histidine kinase n=1 Tax=Deinococcus roseus TaxID=392414 RepID=A0ABQ2CXS8_9DEIO|nr:hybrid sensor histidine kinase/response regulator [Deinococcus roseus]GGJ26732.1 hypothetical protein GCM10008938_11070 [Deinococcus roseus]
MEALRILLVEDNPVDVEILQRHLKRVPGLPATVLQAAYGQDGLRTIRIAPPDVVFLDVNLPDMTGLEFLGQLQNLTSQPAVIVLTGNADESTAVEAMKAGALDYLNKNRLDAHLLERTIKNALERHRLHNELISTQLQLSTMIQEAPVGMALLDVELKFLHVNGTLAELAGLPVEQMEQHFCKDIPSSLVRQLEWVCQRVLLSGKSHRDLEINVQHGTECRFCLSSVYPVHTQNGQVQWVGITVTDISKSKRDAVLLQQSQDRLNLTLEATRVGTWEWQSHNRKIRWMGQTDRILGLPEGIQDAVEEDFLRHIHPEDLDEVRAALQHAWENDSNFQMEMRVQRPDEPVRWVMNRGRVEQNAQHALMSGALIDITDLKEAELALKEISQAQQRFVNDAAHELRAPLTAIQGNLDLIHRYANMTEEDKEEALADVAREATRLSRLVQDMLALAKGDAGTTIRRDPLEMEEVLSDAMHAVSFQLRPHQVSVQMEAATVLGDHDRLKQVLVILLENAAKYTPDGGKLTVTVSNRGNQVVFQVQDSGMGISAADLPRVFERFYRGSFSREKDPGGTGLGLPIARWIVEAHQGRLRLESQPGEGTTAILELPLHIQLSFESGEVSRQV